jgi:predicted nucleic acid-binding protein
MNRFHDVPMDFADGTLVALASAEPALRIATFDADFVAYRCEDGSPVLLVDDRLLGWD